MLSHEIFVVLTVNDNSKYESVKNMFQCKEMYFVVINSHGFTILDAALFAG